MQQNERHSTITHQCAWCASIEDGAFAGELFFVEVEGMLQIQRFETYSHVLCPHCCTRQRGMWERKQMRKRSHGVLPLDSHSSVSLQ